MRFILILLVALALTITWQTSVLAGENASGQEMQGEKGTTKDEKSGTGSDEPECE